MPTVRFSWNDKEVPENVQAVPLLLWVADESGCVCQEHILSEYDIQEEPEKLRDWILFGNEVPIDSHVEG